MNRKVLLTECFVLGGTAGLAGFLLWMSLYTFGVVMLIPAACLWLIFLIAFSHRMRTPKLSAEYGLVAGLLASQTVLVAAIVLRILPSLTQPLAGLL